MLPNIFISGFDVSRYAISKSPKDIKKKLFVYDAKKRFPFKNKKFDLVIIFRYLHRPLLGRLASLLYDNGILIYKTFAEGNEKYGSPKSKKYLLKTKELLKLETPELKILKFNEGLTKINGNKKKMQTASPRYRARPAGYG